MEEVNKDVFMGHNKYCRVKIIQVIISGLLIIYTNSAFSQTLYDMKIEEYVNKFVSETKGKSAKKIAVVNFIDTTSKQRYLLSDILEDDLTTKIIQSKKYDVIIKNKIDEILKELKFGYEGLVDPTKRKQFGKLTQADAILTGSYRERGDEIIINTQLINVETGEAIWAGSVSIPKAEIPAESMQLPNIYQEEPVMPSGEKEKGTVVKRKGTLSIISIPSNADIYLDSESMGKSPAIIQAVKTGKRNITLMKEGYEDYTVKTEVESDKTATLKAVLKKKTGVLRIETKPSGAEVILDGYKKGVSPVVFTLVIGSYKIKVKKENYLDKEEIVTVQYKEEITKTMDLMERPGSLLISVEPFPAEMYMDGVKRTLNPKLSLNVSAGEHKVTISKEGYEDYITNVVIHADEGETISAVLKKNEYIKSKTTESYSIESLIKPVWLNFGCVNLDLLIPTNVDFNKIMSSQLGYSFELNYSWAKIGFSYWRNEPSNMTDITSLTGLALEASLNYYAAFNDNFIFTIGGGGRFEKICVNLPFLSEHAADADFGNNGMFISLGLIYRAPSVSGQGWGLKFNYNFNFASPYTGYHIFRGGVFYEFEINNKNN